MHTPPSLGAAALHEIENGDRETAQNLIEKMSITETVQFMRTLTVLQNIADRAMAAKGH
jgi:hypothetical protein